MLSELLSPERVRVPLESHSRSALFEELVRLALPEGSPATLAAVLGSVETRESQVSTAMGGGLAVPHGRTDQVAEVRVAAGLVNGATAFVGPDGEPVRVVFLVLTPIDCAREHLRVLAGIARVMRNEELRQALLTSKDPTSFMDVVRHADGVVQTT